jgi:hypothetical protein
MSSINRVGQKVVCTVGEWKAWVVVCSSTMESRPREGEVYTVTGFADDSRGCPAIHLLELRGYDCACRDASNEPWDIRAFRPADERKTDISEFESILKKGTVRLPDDQQVDS